ncbi:hypothetical protein TrST_g6111 [Triparma strigata]|uniref:Uncharacterized protein n=1 Tax=Triparma strigata TaxID=1606541 RepID=A0A9W7C2F7_9STRA|nr:hypothetical protein TrST_g6111 [Triparma strigata]
MDEMSAYSGRSVHQEILQKLLSSVHAHEAQMSSIASPKAADELTSDVVERRRAALERGEVEGLLEDAKLGSGMGMGDVSLAQGVCKVSLTVPEKVLPQHLISMFSPNAGTPNRDLSDDALKSLSALSYLCDESNELSSVSQTFISGVLMFGSRPAAKIPEGDEISSKRADELILCIGQSMTFFQELHNFTLRCMRIARNIVCQLAGCLTDDIFRNTKVIPVAEALITVLRILITVDSAVSNNSELTDAWRMYKMVVREKSTKNNVEGVVDEQFATFEKMVVELDGNVLSARCFASCIEQDFNPSSTQASNIDVRNNPALHAELKSLIVILFDRFNALVGSASETNERQQLVGVYGLYAMYRRILPPSEVPDGKLFKKLFTIFPDRCPIVNICGDSIFFPTNFMMEHAPFEVKGVDLNSVGKKAVEFVKRLDASFEKQASQFKTQCLAWIAQCDSELSASARSFKSNEADVSPTEKIESRGSLILKGVVIAYRASALVKTLLALHKALGLPLTSKLITPVRSLVEVLKAIQAELTNRRRAAVATTQPLTLRILASAIFRKFKALKSVVDSSNASAKGSKSRKIKKLAACLAALEGSLKGTTTYGPARRFAAQLAACACSSPDMGVTAQDAQSAEALLRRLSLLADLDHHVKTACSCEWLYFNRELLPVFFSDVYSNEKKADVAGLQLLVNGICDAEPMLRCAPQLNSDEDEKEGEAYVDEYRNFVMEDVLKAEIIDKLCREVENDLRLHIHTKNLDHMATTNPVTDKRMKIRPFMLMQPLAVFDLVVDIHKSVKLYLEASFYNLTTIALHDWLTYSEMKNLAKEKFGLQLADNFLPMGSLDQGLDILQIMRNIHVFVARFNYDLNQQVFIERRPDRGAKYLNTISIESISCSIRQHGLGILNTTVNYTYQYLSKKFHIFSQFLFDDYIRSHLSKEKRWFKKHHKDDDVDNKYPFARAMSFVKDIKKLGVSDGKTFLDRFRILITEIGNALGYVRMVRSAGMKYCSEAVQFLPDIDDIQEFAPLAGAGTGGSGGDGDGDGDGDGEGEVEEKIEGAGLSETTINAAKNLDQCINVVKTNLKDSTDYFHVLVQVFKEVLLGGGDHKQLDNFFMIVPSLCLSWVEASLQAKDMMYKKNRNVRDAYYSDDGFAMGIAYILSILAQHEHFDALHFFPSLREKYDADDAELKRQEEVMAAKLKKKKEAASKKRSFFSRIKKKDDDDDSDDDDEEASALQLTAKRLGAHRRESEMLYFSLKGATIFFSERKNLA